jgi:hypothetical protein
MIFPATICLILCRVGGECGVLRFKASTPERRQLRRLLQLYAQNAGYRAGVCFLTRNWFALASSSNAELKSEK